MAPEQQQQHLEQHFARSRYLVFGFVGIAIVLFLITRFSGVFDDFDPRSILSGGDKSKLITDDGLAIRQCNIVETMCPGVSNCRGANGQVTGANAMDPDGNKCCQFGCEGEQMAVRACHSYEQICDVGQACKMGNNIIMPEAITAGGRSCCKFECDNEGEIPVRAPFSSETICPPGSYCLDYQGKATAPKAKMSNGNSICGYTSGDISPCISP